jgi:hypothetical protein
MDEIHNFNWKVRYRWKDNIKVGLLRMDPSRWVYSSLTGCWRKAVRFGVAIVLHRNSFTERIGILWYLSDYVSIINSVYSCHLDYVRYFTVNVGFYFCVCYGHCLYRDAAVCTLALSRAIKFILVFTGLVYRLDWSQSIAILYHSDNGVQVFA